jgi:hypothetical protein
MLGDVMSKTPPDQPLPKRHCWFTIHVEPTGPASDWCIHCGSLRHTMDHNAEEIVWKYRTVTMATLMNKEPPCYPWIPGERLKDRSSETGS